MHKIFLLLPISAFLSSSLSYGKIYLYHIVLLIIFLYYILNYKKLKALITFNLQSNKIWLAIVSYALLSIIWAPDLKNALIYSSYLICGASLLFIFPFEYKNFIKKIQFDKVMKFLILAHLVICVLEIFTPFRWPISTYSHLAHFFGKEKISFPEFFENYPTSFFWHQNNCALMTLIMLPLFFNLEKKILTIFLVSISLLIIIASGSKSIIVIGSIYLFLKFIKNVFKEKKPLKVFAFVSLILCVQIIGFSVINSMQKQELIEAKNTFIKYSVAIPKFIFDEVKNKEINFSTFDPNTRERFEYMHGAIKLYRESPFIGVGAGGHLNVVNHSSDRKVDLTSMHNYWLELLTVYGPLVLGLYLYWITKQILKFQIQSEMLLLFFVAVPAMSSAIYFIPSWLFLAWCQASSIDQNSRLDGTLS